MGVGGAGGPAVVVDPFSSGGMYAPTFAALGVPTVAIASQSQIPDVYADSYRSADYQRTLIFDGDIDALAGRVRLLRPRCVLPGAESGVELADELTARVVPELANVPALREARRDKGAMGTAVVAAGLPALRQICTNDPGEVEEWIAREGLTGSDLVVKPPKSVSTDGVTRVPGGIGWRQSFDAQLGAMNLWRNRNDRMLVQEYAVGTEYVVDTFSHNGRHTVANVCRYRKINNGPYMAVYAGLSWLPPGDQVVSTLVDYAKGVLDAVGLRWGAAHVEVVLTAAGPRLIEVNARPHGGGHPRYCRVATGDSQLDRAVRHFTGQGTVPSSYVLRCHVRVLFLIARRGGTVRNAEVLDHVRSLRSYYDAALQVRTGDEVRVTRDLLDTLALGFVVLASEDTAQLEADESEVRRIESTLIIGAH